MTTTKPTSRSEQVLSVLHDAAGELSIGSIVRAIWLRYVPEDRRAAGVIVYDTTYRPVLDDLLREGRITKREAPGRGWNIVVYGIPKLSKKGPKS